MVQRRGSTKAVVRKVRRTPWNSTREFKRTQGAVKGGRSILHTLRRLGSAEVRISRRRQLLSGLSDRQAVQGAKSVSGNVV